MSIQISFDGEQDLFAPMLNLVEYSESLDSLNALVARMAVAPDKFYKDVQSKLQVGAPFEITIGDRKLKGDVTRISIRRGHRSGFEVTVFGLETLHRLRNQRISQVVEQARDKVAEKLIKLAGGSAKAQKVSATAEQVVFISDAMLTALKQLADERNFSIYYDGKAVNFAPRSRASGSAVKVKWGIEVRDGEFDFDLVDVVTSTKVVGRDYTKGLSPVEYESKESDLSKISKGDTAIAIRKKRFGEAKLLIPEQVHAADMSEVKERAIAELQRRAESFVRGRVVCNLIPKAAPGKTLEIDGADWLLKGPWMISGVTHTRSIHEGVMTTIDFFSDSLPKK